MKKSTLLFTIAITFMFFSCSRKSVTLSELKEEKSISKPKEEKSVQENLAADLLAEFQYDLGSWNACVVYNGVDYTNLDDYLNRDK